MNHVTLAVTNAKRSLEFYQRLLGLPIVATQGPVPIMRLGSGPQFIALSERPTAKPRDRSRVPDHRAVRGGTVS